ncbi:MAG: M14 family zinc carboxypeptidase [Planctomycetota bacterium]
MSGLLATLLLLAGLAAQDPAPGDAPPAEATAAAAEPVATPPPGLAEDLNAFADRHPAYAAVEELGTSRGGRAILALVLGAREAGDLDRRPGLALVGLGGESERASELALALARYVLDELTPEERERVLGSATLYLIPQLDPDSPASPGARDVRLERNFPIGWQPDTLVPGAGAVPLSEPESKALATFLRGRTNLSLLLGLRGGQAELLPRAGTDGDAAVLNEPGAADAGDTKPRVTLWKPARGSVAAYAWEALGVFPRLLEFRADELQSAARRVAQLAQGLPRLRLTEPAVEMLRPGLYRLDVRIENPGRLPTLSDLGAERRLAGEVELAIQGATVLACAHRAAEQSFEVQSRVEGRYSIGQIAGGGAVELCVLVEAEAGTEITLSTRSPRAGMAGRSVTLP